jgi:GABA(A) receptor-associated protein
MMNHYKNKNSFDKRKQESTDIINKYTGRKPIIVQKYEKSDMQDIDKCKFLVPDELSMTQFMFIIRKRIKLESSQSLFLTINGSLVPSNRCISELYEELKDEDGFLYVTYTNENTFG